MDYVRRLEGRTLESVARAMFIAKNYGGLKDYDGCRVDNDYYHLMFKFEYAPDIQSILMDEPRFAFAVVPKIDWEKVLSLRDDLRKELIDAGMSEHF